MKYAMLHSTPFLFIHTQEFTSTFLQIFNNAKWIVKKKENITERCFQMATPLC